jgi:hypothetical protein
MKYAVRILIPRMMKKKPIRYATISGARIIIIQNIRRKPPIYAIEVRLWNENTKYILECYEYTQKNKKKKSESVKIFFKKNIFFLSHTKESEDCSYGYGKPSSSIECREWKKVEESKIQRKKRSNYKDK